MTKFKNKETAPIDGIVLGREVKISYAKLAYDSLDKPPQGGFTTSIIRKRCDLQAKFDNVEIDADIELNDEEVEMLQGCIVGSTWGINSMEFVYFEEYIENLKEA